MLHDVSLHGMLCLCEGYGIQSDAAFKRSDNRGTKTCQDGRGYIELRSGKAVTNRFLRVITNAGLPHMRFHDLRHLNASVMVALGVPDLYAMERGGWKTKSTLNRVYQQTFSAERQAVDQKIDQYFESLLVQNFV